MWRIWLRRLGVWRSTGLLAALSIVGSVLLTALLERVILGAVPPFSLAVAVVVPACLATPMMYLLLRLMYRLDQTEHELREVSNTDGLTQVYNRRHVLELAERELARVRRYGGAFSVLLFDLDHFKRVNDNHGHLAGDAVLQAAATLIRNQVRPVDAFGRYGGEEFLALLPATALAEAMEVAERIRSSLEALIIPHGDAQIRVTTSIGVASANKDTPDLKHVLGEADEALYLAKKQGRNRVQAADWMRANTEDRA